MIRTFGLKRYYLKLSADPISLELFLQATHLIDGEESYVTNVNGIAELFFPSANDEEEEEEEYSTDNPRFEDSTWAVTEEELLVFTSNFLEAAKDPFVLADIEKRLDEHFRS